MTNYILLRKELFSGRCSFEHNECIFNNFAQSLPPKIESLFRSTSEKDGEVKMFQKLLFSSHWSIGHVEFFLTNLMKIISGTHNLYSEKQSLFEKKFFKKMFWLKIIPCTRKMLFWRPCQRVFIKLSTLFPWISRNII